MNFTPSMKISGRLLKCMKMDFYCCLFGVCWGLFPSEPQKILVGGEGMKANLSRALGFLANLLLFCY